MTHEYIIILLRDSIIYSADDILYMYLICPSGLMEVLYSAFAKGEYKSKYWQVKGDTHVFKYLWEDATYIYSEKKVGFKKYAELNLMTKDKVYRFEIKEMTKMVNQETGLLENLNLDVTEVTQHADGSFFLTMYKVEEDVYNMNKRLVVKDED